MTHDSSLTMSQVTNKDGALFQLPQLLSSMRLVLQVHADTTFLLVADTVSLRKLLSTTIQPSSLEVNLWRRRRMSQST